MALKCLEVQVDVVCGKVRKFGWSRDDHPVMASGQTYVLRILGDDEFECPSDLLSDLSGAFVQKV